MSLWNIYLKLLDNDMYRFNNLLGGENGISSLFSTFYLRTSMPFTNIRLQDAWDMNVANSSNTLQIIVEKESAYSQTLS